jgi:hypothetical protein
MAGLASSASISEPSVFPGEKGGEGGGDEASDQKEKAEGAGARMDSF